MVREMVTRLCNDGFDEYQYKNEQRDRLKIRKADPLCIITFP